MYLVQIISMRLIGTLVLPFLIYSVKKRNGIIEYRSLDPFVRIKCGDASVETTIIVGEVLLK